MLTDEIVPLVSIFYIGYVFFELPSNIVLKKLGAPLWLGILTLVFGVTTLGIGFAKNYATLLALRVLMGVFEAVSTSFLLLSRLQERLAEIMSEGPLPWMSIHPGRLVPSVRGPNTVSSCAREH